MLETIGKDIFGEIATSDALCITTNCTIMDNGENPMGAMAGAAARRWNKLPSIYGSLLQVVGNVPVVLGWALKKNETVFDSVFNCQNFDTKLINMSEYWCAIVAYPTMVEFGAPASLDLVVRSANLLVEMADRFGWKRIVQGRPGCGVGGLDWGSQVRPRLQVIFDDRFVAMHK